MRWISPYYEDGTWLRGNFHTHTTVSDGGHTLEDTADHYFRFCRYKSSPWMQYRFLAITDHRRVTDPAEAETDLPPGVMGDEGPVKR